MHRAAGDASTLLPPDALPLDAHDPASPWLLLPPETRDAFDALRAAGPPLADADVARPTLGVKCGCNDAFLVDVEPGDGPTAVVHAGDRVGRVERALLRPVLRGEDLARPHARDDAQGVASILWTHGDDGAPLPALPPLAARWLAPWRDRLPERAASRGARWWSLFSAAVAAAPRAGDCWADLARTPAPRLLGAGDPTVPLNTCYVAPCDDPLDARALAALLATPLVAAWLGALAEPARGGFRRHLAWTVALLPTPRDWRRARLVLAPALDVEPTARNAIVAAAFGLPLHRLAPLLAWDAGLAPAPRPPVRLVRERRHDAPTAIPAPIAPTRWRGPHARGHGAPC
ncbi:hypothetical protein [Roseisolibacter sp. H3M3-2]|uniref:hypothetical protein n=1 Tax=Roseisolibacter sp. H3M3-2 TaxID=3031323 RepID=UPI0023DB0273|nr:hypothetical protein [Roseisolibacter sp. H3M3-2]MDF1506077.1 hypothetical protein [Roseisolibacter sp. H3M3-2]